MDISLVIKALQTLDTVPFAKIAQGLSNVKTDQAGDIIGKLVSIAVPLIPVFGPELELAAPLVEAIVDGIAANLKTGLNNGTIVPDGAGGYVPSTNSRYDPKTGEFIS